MTCLFRRRTCIAVVWLAVLAAVLSLADFVKAKGSLRKVIGDLADEVAREMGGGGTKAVAIGQFTDPDNDLTSGGPGLANGLKEALEKRKVKVNAAGEHKVTGTYRVVEVPGTDPADKGLKAKVQAVEVEAQVVDKDGKKVGDFSFKRTIYGEETIAELLGITAVLPPDGTERERDLALRRQKADPMPDVQGAVVRAQAGQPYAVEIFVEGKPRPAEKKRGLLYVDIKQKESYAVRIRNDSEHEAAVQLFIDGLNLFAFSEVRQPDKLDNGADNPLKGQPLYTSVIVPPKKNGKPGTALIRGWHVNNKALDKFLVTEYAKSAAGSLKYTGNIGTITATFQAAWEEGKPAPVDEPAKRRGGQGDATGRGDRVGEDFREVVRNFGVIRDVISVRYTRPQAKE